MQNLWDACLRRLEQELPAQQFNTWIRPLAPDATGPVAGADDTLVLTAPNRFVLELVRERFAARGSARGALADEPGDAPGLAVAHPLGVERLVDDRPDSFREARLELGQTLERRVVVDFGAGRVQRGQTVTFDPGAACFRIEPAFPGGEAAILPVWFVCYDPCPAGTLGTAAPADDE